MRGRRPKPTRLKKLQGNPGKRPPNRDEPEPPAVAPGAQCPAYLDAVGQKEWKRISGILTASRLLSELDTTALGAYCREFSKWIAAEEQVKKFGSVLKSPSGYPILNPHVSLAKAAFQSMHRLLVEFGMTPASRSRLRVEKPEEKADPLEAFLSRGKTSKDVTVN